MTFDRLVDDFKRHIFPFQAFLICPKEDEFGGDVLFIDFPNQLLKFACKGKTRHTFMFREMLAVHRDDLRISIDKKDKKTFSFFTFLEQADLVTDILKYAMAFSKTLNVKFESEEMYCEKSMRSENSIGTVHLTPLVSQILREYQILGNDSYLPTGTFLRCELKLNKFKRIGFLGLSNLIFCQLEVN